MALLLGIAVGFSAGRFAAEERQKLAEATSWAPLQDMQRADRYLRRGTVNSDPSVRDLAILMAQHRLNRLERSRPRPAVLCAALGVVFLILTLVWSPQLWPGAVIFGALALTATAAAYSLRRRLRHLDPRATRP